MLTFSFSPSPSLKPENILVVDAVEGEEDDREERIEKIKVGDFGLSKVFDEGEDLKSQCGSPTCRLRAFGHFGNWSLFVRLTLSSLSLSFGLFLDVAPEVLLCKPYDAQVDMWAIGVISFVLVRKIVRRAIFLVAPPADPR
jgi:calcium/calmodulin-dependent protein kinase I